MPAVTQDVVVVGIGETPVGKLPGMSPVEIQAWAVRNALKDCGLSVRELDGLINLPPYCIPNTGFATTLAEYLGAKLSYCATIDVGGTATAVTMFQQAAWAIESGDCEVVVCASGENMVTGRPKGRHGFILQNLAGGEEFEVPFGVPSMVSQYALVTQRYMHEFGTTQEDCGAVAIATRAHAVLNENAVMKRPLSMQEYLASPMISSPLRLLDCSIPADGAGAMVFMSRKRARRLGLAAVGMRSMAVRLTHNTIIGMPELTDFSMGATAREVMESAGIGPGDLDVATVHDAFPISVILMLETFGFAARGQAGDYIRDGNMSLGGKCPLNTHGGCLSQGHFGGFLHPLEIVRQLRGSAGRRQVEGARLGLVAGNGGLFAFSGAMIFEREAK